MCVSGLEGVKKPSALVCHLGLAENEEIGSFSAFGFWFIYDELLRAKTMSINS